ncbi:MAG: DegT/DnrJ/EryC1/StrS family aminotransferase [Spirochaetes bacterium]|nr:DegT/DnrJ/EryC1/StrS family aminotransferase [Spirochaetota bacterium]
MRKKTIGIGDFQIGDDEIQAVHNVLVSQRITEGIVTRKFEQAFAKYIGTQGAVAVNSGSSALLVAYLTFQVCGKSKKWVKGKKVITSPLTYVATANAMVLAGFEPVFVDVDPKRFVITPENIERAIHEHGADNIAGIVPVHLMGYACDMDPIMDIARKHDLFVLEDAAQAHGSLYKGKCLGTYGDAAIFSFYIAHNIQAGEMGAIVSNDQSFLKLVKQMKANGRLCDCFVCTRSKGTCPNVDANPDSDNDPRFMHRFISGNFKTMDLVTALALTQVGKADAIFKKRSETVKYLNEKLASLEPMISLPPYSPEVSYLAYPLVVNDSSAINRKAIRRLLEEQGIENRPLFGSIPSQQPAYEYLKSAYAGKLPNADYLGTHALYIGCHQYLTQEDIDYIVAIFKKLPLTRK